VNEVTTFILQGNFVYLPVGVTDKIEEAIRQEFSYGVQNRWFIPSVKQGTWDGIVRLYRYRRFPIGLLDDAIEIVRRLGGEVSIIDQREDLGVKLGLQYHGPSLRYYQKDAVQAALSKDAVIIVSPTSAGKTLTAIALIAARDLRTLILVNSKLLLYQWKEEIKKNLHIEAALIGDGHREEGPITIATMQSLLKQMPEQSYDMVIADEVHHVAAAEWGKIMSSLTCRYRVGLSATPWREDGAEILIQAHTGPILKMGNVTKLIKEGFIAGVELQVIQGASKGVKESWAEEYQNTLEDVTRMERLSQKAIDLYQEGHRLYIDVKRIKHGEQIEKDLRSRDMQVVFLSGRDTSKRRKEVLTDFEEGDRFILISTLIKEGVDLPAMSAIVLSGGGKSGTALIQVVGRALRPKEGSRAVIVDVEDHGKYMHKHFNRRMQVMQNYYGESLKSDLPTPTDPWEMAEKL
jgi:superfamily II DNA or RNA helicase